ncbi:MAG: hypothetical protein WD467_00495 [Candidatus Saccharimonadales bacterium]
MSTACERFVVADYLKQTSEPLFPDIFWNKPINKRAAGSLLMLGGHGQQFSGLQAVYTLVQAFGVGTARLVLPDSLRSMVGAMENGVFLPSTPSGSFASSAAEEAIVMANEHDGVLLPGELSNNNETTSFLESLVTNTKSHIFTSGEVIEQLLPVPHAIANIAGFVATPLQLSRWAKALHVPIYVKTPDLHKEIELLTALGELGDQLLISYTPQQIIANYGGEISVTPTNDATLSAVLAAITVFCLQHTDRFQAATSGIWQATHPRPL